MVTTHNIQHSLVSKCLDAIQTESAIFFHISPKKISSPMNEVNLCMLKIKVVRKYLNIKKRKMSVVFQEAPAYVASMNLFGGHTQISLLVPVPDQSIVHRISSRAVQ